MQRDIPTKEMMRRTKVMSEEMVYLFILSLDVKCLFSQMILVGSVASVRYKGADKKCLLAGSKAPNHDFLGSKF